MNRQQVTRNYQQSKNETPLLSGILQRAAVSPEMDDVQSKDDHETQALINSAFSQDFSKVPISGTKPQHFAVRNPQSHLMSPLQAKLTIGQPGDQYEQEADRIASQVVEQINAPTTLQHQEEPEEQLQAKPSISHLQRREGGAGGEVSTDVESTINSVRGGGMPLDAGLQNSMGQTMGADFSKVRVHTGFEADQLNRSIQAKAFTTGQDVFFRQGEYNPGSRRGQELIAHELTHVVQQNNSVIQAKEPKIQLVRERSNAITHRDHIGELEYALKAVDNLPPEYNSFCDLIFANPEIMEGEIKNLDGLIYNLYTKSGLSDDAQPYFDPDANTWDTKKIDKFYQGIAAASPNAFLQNEEYAVTKIIGDLFTTRGRQYLASKPINPYHLLNDFVYTHVRSGEPSTRVYANLAPDSMPTVAKYLLKHHGVTSFKFAGIVEIGRRADSLVVYCLSREVANEIAGYISGQVDSVVDGRPAMTKGISSGVGIGAEPKAEATGMRSNLEGDVSAQSFGTIRSELLASAILHYRENLHMAAELEIPEKELFKKFVGIFLKGWSQSLNPDEV